ncbi:MAG: hypothetical protein U0805_11990 [Pirellulales bacterium]
MFDLFDNTSETALAILLLIASAIEPAEADEGRVKPLFRDLVGLNVDFNFRPELYAPVCRLVRNYHNITWDVNHPGDPITFPRCVNGVDWDQHVYSPWRKRQFEIDLCAQIDSFGPSQADYKKWWDRQEKWIRQYGFEMAKYFGPSGAHKLVTSIEIGNEPGNKFDDALYRRLFAAMAQGIRMGDKQIKIATAATRAGPADEWLKSLDETYSEPEFLKLYDVINLHDYATRPARDGQSPWDRSYPEDPTIPYLSQIDEAIRWRDQHSPKKEIWISEFGYDACTPAAMQRRQGWFEKLNWRGQSDLEQAQYLVRSLLWFAERGVDRAYIFFYNDADQAAVHGASGLTRNFEPKASYWAVRYFARTLADFRFSRVVENVPGERTVVEFKQGRRGGRLMWVVWAPTGDGRQHLATLANMPAVPTNAERMPTKDGRAEQVSWKTVGRGSIELSIDGSPIILAFPPKHAD